LSFKQFVVDSSLKVEKEFHNTKSVKDGLSQRAMIGKIEACSEPDGQSIIDTWD